MAVVLDIPAFRAMFPLFANETTYPDMLITMYWAQAKCMMDDECYNGCLPTGDCAEIHMYLLLAHFLWLHKNIMRGKQGGFISSSSVDKVSVTKVAPPVVDMFDWWMGQSQFGQQLLTMLLIDSVGGFSVGGLPERQGFRKVYGTFE